MQDGNAAAPSDALAYSVDDAAQVIGLSRSKIYELFDTGELQPVKVGRRTLIERGELERFLVAHRRPDPL